MFNIILKIILSFLLFYVAKYTSDMQFVTVNLFPSEKESEIKNERK